MCLNINRHGIEKVEIINNTLYFTQLWFSSNNFKIIYYGRS